MTLKIGLIGCGGITQTHLEREDTAMALVKFEDGMIGQLFSSWGLRGPGARPTLFYIIGEAGQL